MYIDTLNEIVVKYNNICHRAIKMEPVNVKSGTCIDYDVEHNDEDPKFKVGDHENVKIQKYFCKGLHSKLVEVFMIKKVKKVVSWM